MGSDAGSPRKPSTLDEVQQELARVQRAVRGVRDDSRRVEVEIANTRLVTVVTAIAVGLLALLATTWLVPTGTYTQAAHFFADARTGVGLLNGPWQTTEPALQWIGTVGLLIYIASAIIVVSAASFGGWIPTAASCLGLVATVAVLAAKPGQVDFRDWDYSWQSPPYLACGFWLLLIVLTANRMSRRR